MPQKDEFDQYSVPAKSRFQIFKWGLGGMSATASVLLIMLLRCFSNSESKTERLLNAQIEYIKEQAKSESQRQIQKVDNSLSPQIDEAANSLDSIKHEIKALKN